MSSDAAEPTNNQENTDKQDEKPLENPENAENEPGEEPVLSRKKRHLFDMPVRENVGFDGAEQEEFN